MGIKGEKNVVKDEEGLIETKNISMIKNLFYIILGIIGLKIGGDLAVNNASAIAREWGIS